MVMIIPILIISLIAIYIEIPRLLNKGYNKEIFTFIILLLFALIINVSYFLDVNIPNPLDGAIFIFTPLNNLLKTLLN